MKRYKTSVEISAPRDRVWHVLTRDVPKDPAAFGLLSLEGGIALNGRIKLRSEVDPKRVFALKVTTFAAPHQMVWRGGMPFGLFTGTRSFRLSGSGGVTTFEMEEVFSGVLSGAISKSIPDLTPSFEKFARTLKEKAETHD